MSKIQIGRISAIAELERAGLKFESIGNNELKVHCPVHEDENPSARLNIQNNLWKCFTAGCSGKGDLITLLALHAQVDRSVVLTDLVDRYDLVPVKSIASDTVEKFHAALQQSPHVDALKARGVTDDMMRAARIGHHAGRVTIPVYDLQRRVVDVLRYLPGAPGDMKMRHTKGYNTLRLYQPEDLRHQTVWVCGGPLKALVAKHLLNQHGVGAVSSTGGEGTWEPSWSEQFRGKDVVVCYDIDTPGAVSAEKVASQLLAFAASVRVATLPLDPEKYPKGDLNDWIGQEGATAQQLFDLGRKSPTFEPPTRDAVKELGTREVTLEGAIKPELVGWRLRMEAMPVALAEDAYLVPREVDVECDRAQPSCGQCPVYATERDAATGFTPMTVWKSGRAMLSLIGCSVKGQANELKEALAIPPCKVAEFQIRSHRKVLDARLSPKISLVGQGSGTILQPAFIVDQEVDLNVPYKLEALLYPSPEDGKATLLVDKAIEAVDSLGSFELEPEDLAELRLFQPTKQTDEALEARLQSIYNHLACNVTGIYDRREMHELYDLAYHSALYVPYRDRPIKGWLNVLVLGDSAQGKSEAFLRLQEHYTLGERVECKNATVAGLLGGVQQISGRWFTTWGVIVHHDRGLVALEEINGAPVEVLGKLTDMRSSGIAELPKIERRQARARTRLIFISNPRNNRSMGSYSFGVEAMLELMGSPQDVRRFDLATVVAAGEVNHSTIRERRIHPEEYSEDLARKLILWAWTRTADQVEISTETEQEIERVAAELYGEYDERIPLLDSGTGTQKLTRIAAAVAARVFSTDEIGEVLQVLPVHVRYAAGLMRRCYGTDATGYGNYSATTRRTYQLREPARVENYIRNSLDPQSLVAGLLTSQLITADDIADFGDLDRDSARRAASFFVRHNALRREKRSYLKTQGFIELLRKLEQEDLTKKDFDGDM